MAIVLPEPLQGRVMELKRSVKKKYGSGAALRSPAHITLHMPFEWRKEKEELLYNTLDAFSFPKTISVELKDFSHFDERVIFVNVVQNEPIREMQKELVKHVKFNLNIFNEADNRRGFHPHVTIAFRDLKKAAFREAWEYFKKETFTANFSVRGFELLKHEPGIWKVHREFGFAR